MAALRPVTRSAAAGDTAGADTGRPLRAAAVGLTRPGCHAPVERPASAGIREIRETIRALGESGVTVLLSSHILAEVQQVCDGVSIIGHGTLLASGSVADVVGVAGAAYALDFADLAAGADVLTREGYAVRRDGDRLVVDTDADSASLTEHLAGDADEGSVL